MNNESVFRKLAIEYGKFNSSKLYFMDLSFYEEPDEEYLIRSLIRDLREINPHYKEKSLDSKDFISYIRSVCGLTKAKYIEVMEYSEYAVEIGRYIEKENAWDFFEQVDVFDDFDEAEDFIDNYEEELPEDCELRILEIEYDVCGNEKNVCCVY